MNIRWPWKRQQLADATLVQQFASINPSSVLVLGSATRGVAEAAAARAPSGSVVAAPGWAGRAGLVLQETPIGALNRLIQRRAQADLVVFDTGREPPSNIGSLVSPGGMLAVIRDGRATVTRVSLNGQPPCPCALRRR